jgi:hypothetical protein
MAVVGNTLGAACGIFIHGRLLFGWCQSWLPAVNTVLKFPEITGLRFPKLAVASGL